jgi:TRAP-type mannitol/chloroaromatic compound transport system permease small subunit
MGPATKKITTFLGTLCGLFFVALITYGLWNQAIKSVMIFEVSADTSGFPIWPWKLACPIGASLCVVTMIGQLIQQIFTSSSLKESK